MRLGITIFLLCVSTSASAYTDIDIAKRAYAAIPYPEIYAPKVQRKEMASAINDYWQDFSSRLPRLSPNELAWIEKELDTTDSIRIGRVVESKEYPLWMLEKIANQCTSSAAGLMAAMNSPDLSETEMFHWTKVANCYHASDGSIAGHLRAAALDLSNDISDGHMLDSLMLSRILLVALPSAMADTMGWELSGD